MTRIRSTNGQAWYWACGSCGAQRASGLHARTRKGGDKHCANYGCDPALLRVERVPPGVTIRPRPWHKSMPYARKSPALIRLEALAEQRAAKPAPVLPYVLPPPRDDWP